MPDIILVIDPPKGQYFARVARCAERLRFVCHRARGAFEALRYLAKIQRDTEKAPLAVVIGGGGRYALDVAEHVHHLAPLVHIVFVANETQSKQLTQGLQTGDVLHALHWAISPPADDHLCLSLTSAVQATRSRKDQTRMMASELERLSGAVVAEILPQMVWSAGDDGIWDYYNSRWRLFTGLSQAQLQDGVWHDLLHPEDKLRISQAWDQACSQHGPFETEARLRDAKGGWPKCCIKAEYRPGVGGLGRWFGTCDVVQKSPDAQESARFLSEVARRVTESLDYESTLTNLAHVVVPRFADWCAVDVVNPEGRLERLSVAHSDPAMARYIAAHNPDTEVTQLTASDVLRTGTPQLVTYIDQTVIDSAVRDPAQRAFFASLGLRSLLRLPLRARGRTVGVISFVLSGAGTRRYSEADLPLATEIAQQGAIAVENARLYRAAREELEVRRRAEEALALSEARYRSFIEATAQIVWGLDATGHARDDMANWRAFTGQSVDEVAGHGWMEVVDPAHREILRGAFGAARAPQAITAEVNLRSYDGSYRCVAVRVLPLFNQQGDCQEWIAAGTDITREKTAADLLEREKERLAVTLNSLGEAVVTTDVEGRIVLFNRVAQTLTGWSQKDALGCLLGDVFSLVDVRSRTRLADPAAHVLKAGEVVGPTERGILSSQGGDERVVAYTAAPIRDRASRISGAVIVFRDITFQQKLEEDFLKAQKLESVGVLAGGIAHDFNNILTAVIGNIALAKMFTNLNDRLSHALGEAEKAAWRARGLTQQLLTFAKGGAPVKKPGSLGDLLREVVPFALTGSNVKCALSVRDDLWTLAFDPGQLSQAVNNLVINAAQAMPDGGLIHIDAENYDLRGQEGVALPPGHYVRLTIADDGVGIAESHIDKIFDPYFTTKEGRTGLGLATTYSIVRRHEGLILVQSEEGRGARFEILLPAHGTRPLVPLASKMQRGQGRILLMDDEPSLLQVATALLCHLGYEVEGVSEGAEALARYEAASREGRPFAAVILDLTVPAGMGGAECVRRLRAVDPGVRALVSTGYYNDPIVADFARFGFCGAITKPYQLHELSEAIRHAIVENGERLR